MNVMRGSVIGYWTLHKWINRTFPRTGRCEFCASMARLTTYAEARPGRRARWRHDWFELCGRCHTAYDGRVVGDRGQAQGAQQRAKTHCPQGHPYDEANTYIHKHGHRYCRACGRAATARYRQRRQVTRHERDEPDRR